MHTEQATPHRHVKRMTIWINDTRKVVLEDRHDGEGFVPRSIPTWLEQFDYKFADEVMCPGVSMLTDDEINEIAYNSKMGMPGGQWRAIANGAARAERIRIAKLPAVTSLSDADLQAVYDKTHGWKLTAQANAGIRQFQIDLLQGDQA